MRRLFYIIIIAATVVACQEQKKPQMTPWGTVMGDDGTAQQPSAFSLDDIIAQGELIMLTETGPQTYYDYHGHGMGQQFLLCENFAKQIGVKVRVEVCKDSIEMLRKLHNGEGDVIANSLNINKIGEGGNKSDNDSLNFTKEDFLACGPQWVVSSTNKPLAEALNKWYKPELLTEINNQQKTMLSMGGVQRRVYSPMLNSAKGIISKYDNLFMKYAPVARLDWRLLAAQCYQESCFDPNAHSWAGACGLMQIIPSTAAYLGLSMSDIYSPEPNIAAAARLMQQLMAGYRDAASQNDRISFALASYNAGSHHIHDAQALARKYGGDPRRWNDVAPYVLKLQEAQYYRDPVVKYGYMRGSETVDYVSKIHARWAQYRGSAHGSTGVAGSTPVATPHASKRKHKYKL